MGHVGIHEGLRLKVFPACRKYLEIGDFDSIMGL